MSQEMFTISEKLFKLLTDHVKQNNCDDNCCVKQLLDNLEFSEEPNR
jgi:hypothetical protein